LAAGSVPPARTFHPLSCVIIGSSAIRLGAFLALSDSLFQFEVQFYDDPSIEGACSMNRLGWALAAFSLTASAVSFAASTPEGALKDFLKAAQKKDRPALTKSIDWEALGKEMGVDQEKDAHKRQTLLNRLRIVYVEGFAMGKEANAFKIGKVTANKDEAKGTLMRMDPATKKLVPTTDFIMHKKGKNWLIYNITAAKKAGGEKSAAK
jgi:hypothetical protein